ncbi:MAG: pentapeptide repeat-containing protein [Methanothrix sp.]|nr:pentapeptide repeat-containing protein [Methanothrix sp.]
MILGSLNLKGTVLQEILICENTKFEGSVYLIGTHFQQVADFRSAQFNQTDFSNAQFNQEAYFEDAQFNQTDFSNAQFNQDALFEDAQFNQIALFSHAQFNQTDFRNAQFNQAAFFGDAQFNQIARFSHAQFNQTNFRNAQFNQEAYFEDAQFNQIANFAGAQFKQTAFFERAQFNQATDFSYVRFNWTADFWCAQFNQATDFSHVRFNRTAVFRHVLFSQTDFRYAQFNQTADFWNVGFDRDADFEKARFNQEAHFEDAYLRGVFFNNCLFSKEAFFDNTQINGTLSLFRTKYEKLNIRWSSIHDLAYDDTAYYLLIENFKKLGFTDDASECYYSYRCKHREELFRQGKIDSWFFDLLAWATNGYGLRPVRPLGWSVLFILLGGVFFFVTKSISRSKGPEPSGNRLHAIRCKDSPRRVNEVSIWEALLLSATYFTSGASAIISSVPQEFSPGGRSRYVVVILRLLGWVFFVLFLTSLGKIA